MISINQENLTHKVSEPSTTVEVPTITIDSKPENIDIAKKNELPSVNTLPSVIVPTDKKETKNEMTNKNEVKNNESQKWYITYSNQIILAIIAILLLYIVFKK